MAKNWQILWEHFNTHFFMFEFVVKVVLPLFIYIQLLHYHSDA